MYNLRGEIRFRQKYYPKAKKRQKFYWFLVVVDWFFTAVTLLLK